MSKQVSAKQQALRPGFFQDLPTLVKEKQATARGITEEEKDLYSLSLHPGWRSLTEYINSLLKDLDQGTAVAMSQGLSFEEIGRNAVVIDLAKSLITKILNKVNDAKEASEKPDGTIK